MKTLEEALTQATALRFLCSGNMVRSAYAEVWAKHRGVPLPVDSAATRFQNQGLFPETRVALAARGVPEAVLDRFVSRHLSLLTREDPEFLAGLVVFGMTRDHLDAWRRMHPEHDAAFLLGELTGAGQIADPVLEGARFEDAFGAVEAAVEALLGRLG